MDASDRIVASSKMRRAERHSVKADLERELERVVLDCARVWQDDSLRRRIGVRAGHMAHAERADLTSKRHDDRAGPNADGRLHRPGARPAVAPGGPGVEQGTIARRFAELLVVASSNSQPTLDFGRGKS